MEKLDLNRKYSKTEAFLNVKPARHLLRVPVRLKKALIKKFEQSLTGEGLSFERCDFQDGKIQYEIVGRMGLMSLVGGKQVLHVQFDNYKGWCRAGVSFGEFGLIGGLLRGGLSIVGLDEKIFSILYRAVEAATKGKKIPEVGRDVWGSEGAFEMCTIG